MLGCTHFPPLATAIKAVLHDAAVTVDSAATTAEAVEGELARLGLLRTPKSGATSGEAEIRFLTTDAPERFARVAPFFTGSPIAQESLELVVL